MSKTDAEDDPPFDLAKEIEEGLRDAIAWSRGEIDLPTRIIPAMPATRVKTIRKSVAKNTRDFERRFHVPARTVEGWEQGKRVDAPAAALLRVIEKDPEAVERALAEG